MTAQIHNMGIVYIHDTMSPRMTVLSSPNLLEAILLRLPFLDVLLAQRVNRTFHKTIKQSRPLQRALFLQPYGDSTVSLDGWEEAFSTKDCGSQDSCEASSYHMEDILDATLRDDCKCKWVLRGKKSDKPCGMLYNPLYFVAMELISADIAVDENNKNRLQIYGRGSSREVNASWRNMLMTQPPVRCLLVDTLGVLHWHVLRSDEGSAEITFGHFEKFLKTFRKVSPEEATIYSASGSRILPVTSTAAEILSEIEDATGIKQEGMEC
ncbi:hypothetical protein CKM354_001153400 [Cercospora kikuchii]|uniref:F-box domain-containing protein n=1 Tax=Cercospora kikuchii TaxID=84275 RepID=A0A9P3CYM2_9PEZI|nr:uncharacterized protein CKM354_001153400 [Cercospora kikuchii]GIZ48475.1 hypothetical protein CKM354_001153400 [Cercospora kikuchii]